MSVLLEMVLLVPLARPFSSTLPHKTRADFSATTCSSSGSDACRLLPCCQSLRLFSSKNSNKKHDKVPTRGDDQPPILSSSSSSSSVAQPFGRQEYWESFYQQQQQQQQAGNETDNFSWYSTWQDMEPFVREWQAPPPPTSTDTTAVLVPGIGSDADLLQSLYAAGYAPLAAFDYAASSIAHCQAQWNGTIGEVDWAVADATQPLPYRPQSMDLILDKGTLDAIFISARNKDNANEALPQAVTQLQRVLKPGGIFWSLSGICTDALRTLDDCWNGWQVCADSTVELVTTSDGFTSNNLNGDLLVWRKPLSR